jgi:integrase
VLWRWLPENPCDRVVRPKYYAERKEVWTAEQLRAFLGGTVDDRLHPFWMLAVTTGCRFGELTGARWTDVDYQPGTLTIRRNLQRIKGKWVFSEPKTRAGQRTIALPPEAVVTLRHQKALQAEWRLKIGDGWHDNGLVFTSLTGQPLEPSAVTRGTQRACERLGLPYLTPHQLRHLHATLLLAEGVPIPAVSARLGHATPSITMSVYAHAVRRQDEEAAQVFRRVLAGG